MDKSEIFKAAWARTRRELNSYSEAGRKVLGIKTKDVFAKHLRWQWVQAKAIAASQKATEAQFAALRAIPTPNLVCERTSLINGDWIGQVGIERLHKVEAELRQRGCL